VDISAYGLESVVRDSFEEQNTASAWFPECTELLKFNQFLNCASTGGTGQEIH
jgi:hypothetical protein